MASTASRSTPPAPTARSTTRARGPGRNPPSCSRSCRKHLIHDGGAVGLPIAPPFFSAAALPPFVNYHSAPVPPRRVGPLVRTTLPPPSPAERGLPFAWR